MKIYELNGRKVWLDPKTAPAEAIPYGEPKKEEPKKVAPVKKDETEEKAAPVPANKAKKVTSNKSRKEGGKK